MLFLICPGIRDKIRKERISFFLCSPVLHTNQTEDEDDDEYEYEALRRRPCLSFHQIARRGLKQILDWEKALGESSNRTLKR